SAHVTSLSDQLARRALDPLVRLAEKTRTALLFTRHLTKTVRGPRAIYRGTGVIAVIGAARSAFLVARHPTDADLRLFACTKTTLGRPPASWASRPAQEPGQPPAIAWLGEAPFAADELVARAAQIPFAALPQAIEFLRDTICPGGLPAETLFRVA